MATKKATKVVTPIDQRETFVSLSTHSGETDAKEMEQKLQILYQIQNIDTKIDKIYLLRGELPLEVEDLEDEIEGLKTRIANTLAEIKEIEKYNTEYKHQIEESKKAIAKYEEQRNDVKNNREFESLSKEIEYQELEISVSEKNIKEGTAIIAEKKLSLEESKTALAGRQVDLADKEEELKSITEETAKEEEELLKKRASLVATLDERAINAYERVRRGAKNRLAVVTVERGACGGCFNNIPPQRELDVIESKKMIICEHCGRILVKSPDKQEE